MPRHSKNASVALGGHLVIGLVLGALFALALLLRGDFPVFGLIRSGPSPRLVLVMYVGVFAMTFGIGTTLTGLVLEATDEQRD